VAGGEKTGTGRSPLCWNDPKLAHQKRKDVVSLKKVDCRTGKALRKEYKEAEGQQPTVRKREATTMRDEKRETNCQQR